MKKIPVKYGIDTFIIILLPFLFIISESISNEKFSGILVSFAVLAFVCWMVFGIQYFLDGQFLIIKNIFFGKTKIDINEITKVEKTSNMLSSPAPSLTGRIEIYYGNKSIVISPNFFEEFKNELLRINPNINF
ncbi:MAG: PH domain-containing protein [Flavobacteriales bacterium]|nr:PH domain-containing protein [Flavobacteriales bacterium]MCA0392002.1 PH domain-containing protein [Bacteroidota bacterium]